MLFEAQFKTNYNTLPDIFIERCLLFDQQGNEGPGIHAFTKIPALIVAKVRRVTGGMTFHFCAHSSPKNTG
jgi:hypothetical protein